MLFNAENAEKEREDAGGLEVASLLRDLEQL
jgi:hypothetical protein